MIAWTFDNSSMTFDNTSYTFDGLFQGIPPITYPIVPYLVGQTVSVALELAAGVGLILQDLSDPYYRLPTAGYILTQDQIAGDPTSGVYVVNVTVARTLSRVGPSHFNIPNTVIGSTS